jgi:hypothetical protein
MSFIYNDSSKNRIKFYEDPIQKKYKNFLSYKFFLHSPNNSSFSRQNKNKAFLVNDKYKFLHKSSNNIKLKNINLSKILNKDKPSNNNSKRNKRNKDFVTGYKTYNQKVIKKRNKDNDYNKQINIGCNMIKTFENHLQKKNIKLRKIQSAKQIENSKNFDQKLIKSRVNSIVKDLLSKKGLRFKAIENNSRNIFPLNKSLNPTKYIEYNLQNEPNNPKLFKSYKKQMKYLMDENTRKFLIEGINDYHENLKKYKIIYFDMFSKINDGKNFTRRKINDKIFRQKNINKTFKYSDILYENGKEKFKNNYLKAYEKNMIEKENNKINKNNAYFKYLDNNEFMKIMSLDDRMKMAYSSTKKFDKTMSKDTIDKLRKKYIF